MYHSPTPTSVRQIDWPCNQCDVRNKAVCKSLQSDRISTLGAIKQHRHFDQKQTIWRDDTNVSHVNIVVSGVVKLSKILPDGRDQIVALAFPTDILGNVFSRRNEHFAEAITDVELCRFPIQHFERVLSEQPKLGYALLKKTTADLNAAREWMVALGRKDATERVASLLVMLSKRTDMLPHPSEQPHSNYPRFVIPLSRADIATFLALTIETVCRKLTLLKSMRIIEIASFHTVEVLDPDGLEALAGENK